MENKIYKTKIQPKKQIFKKIEIIWNGKEAFITKSEVKPRKLNYILKTLIK